MELKKTKILCTVGPASTSSDVLRKMYRDGMNGIRINTAFGDVKQYESIVHTVREIGEIPILIDLKGPEIRIQLPRSIDLTAGDLIEVGHGCPIQFSYNIHGQLSVGDRILIDDGALSLRVTTTEEDCTGLVVEKGGRIDNGKGVNVPNKHLIVPSISDRDVLGLAFAKEHDVEFIALSFVRGRDDIAELKSLAHGLRSEIVAKIENRQGVEHFEEILEEADGIMVARGDLGVELDLETIPLIQKQLIQRCNQEGKLVITATEMLESMTFSTIPTRAEVSDVANAILDGTDVVMLSGETAIGNYPVEAVAVMTKIAKEVEGSTRTKVTEERFRNISSTIGRSIWQIARTMPLDKVITLTRTGYTAKMITRFKLLQPIIAITPDRIVKHQLELYYGVQPILYDYETGEDRVLSVAKMLHSKGMLNEEENALFTAGIRTSKPHTSNLIEIHTVKELLEFGEPFA